MNAWSNIETDSRDPEIIRIDEFEAELGKLPEQVKKVRELITRLEVCHFKYKSHIQKIKASIAGLNPIVEPGKIGEHHIQHGEDVWKEDSSGKSRLGQEYVHAMNSWLGEPSPKETPELPDTGLKQKVQDTLGEKPADKQRLVKLLVARLTWDWDSLKKLQRGGASEELEMQIIRMDICHYAFPAILNKLLEGLGKMEPVEAFEGCGSVNSDIQAHVKTELDAMQATFINNPGSGLDKDVKMRTWLTACFMKTLKVQIGSPEPSIFGMVKTA